jgi:hypothetical protein
MEIQELVHHEREYRRKLLPKYSAIIEIAKKATLKEEWIL